MKQVRLQTAAGLRKTLIVCDETTPNDIIKQENINVSGTMAHINGEAVRSARDLDMPFSALAAPGEEVVLLSFIQKNTNATR